MEITRKDGKSSTRISLTGELTIYHAADAKPRLLDDQRPWPASVQLDLAGISELDTAGVQLLLMLHKSVTAAGSKLKLQQTSVAARQVFETLGLPPPFTAVAGASA